MIKHFLRSKAPIRAVAVLAALASGVVLPPAAQAVRPGRNGRVAYLKAAPGGGYDVQVFFDHRFNKRLTDSHDFIDRVTWCDHETLVAEEAGVGIVVLPISRESDVGTPYVLYDDPKNNLQDPACDPSGTRVAAADLSTNSIVTIPVSGRRGLTSAVAKTALGGEPHEPAWSSSGDYIAYEDRLADASVIEVAAASRHFVGSGTIVTPQTGELRHGPSWREEKIYYWKETPAPPPAPSTEPPRQDPTISSTLTDSGGMPTGRLHTQLPAPDPSASHGIFSIRLGDLNEFGPYGGTQAEKCIDPAARPDGDGFLCVGSDTFIKVFPGPRTLINTDARKPDVERLSDEHHDEHHHCHCKS